MDLFAVLLGGATARVLVGRLVLLDVFESGVPPQTTGGKVGGAAFGQRPVVMLAGFATIVPSATEKLTRTKNVNFPL